MDLKPKKLAVLIDADNSSINSIEPVLEEIAKFGIASVKRVYGDWSSDTLKNWRDVLLPHAITPVQQFAYTKGKDATDMILIIDAMDLLYSGALDGFCIVSSDSDFTPLASRIRESGLMVYGFGRKKTPEAFKKACDKFIFVENLVEEQERVRNNSESNIEASDAAIKPASKQHDIQKSDSVNSEVTLGSDDKKDIPTDVPIIDRATLNLIYKAVKDNTEDNGWANLSLVGQYLTAVKPDFDSRNYGRAKLSGLIKLLNLFETKIEDSQMYLKKKKKTGV
ncbi:MAG: NYN domain-containing protein [Acinetobacter sp.]|nr:NYN domain-containing protein [Acinetobacter sp.]MBP6352273.1 NYN domain-containing protein [Acinetobacter sp.]MBP7218206.1 NYN domain-containing protein [Acinetobacter sp.]